MASSKVSEIAAKRSPGHGATVTFGGTCWARATVEAARKNVMTMKQYFIEGRNPDLRKTPAAAWYGEP